jgi:hypothetical protein
LLLGVAADDEDEGISVGGEEAEKSGAGGVSQELTNFVDFEVANPFASGGEWIFMTKFLPDLGLLGFDFSDALLIDRANTGAQSIEGKALLAAIEFVVDCVDFPLEGIVFVEFGSDVDRYFAFLIEVVDTH